MATVNLHTHTARCKHAKGFPADYARAAEAQGIRVLGMTDHTPFPDDRIIMIRMGIGELDDYIREVREAQRDFPQLKILLGLECEYFPEYDLSLPGKDPGLLGRVPDGPGSADVLCGRLY